MNLLEKIEALKQIRALLEAMQRQPNEQAYQVLSICLDRIQHKYQYTMTATQLDPSHPFYAQLNSQYLNSWLDATTEQEQRFQQQLKQKPEPILPSNIQATHAAQSPASGMQSSVADSQHTTAFSLDASQLVLASESFATEPVINRERSTEINNNHNTAADISGPHTASSSTVLNKHNGYSLLAYHDILHTPLMPIAEATATSQTPILVLKERQQLRLIHGVERLRLAKLLNQSHVNALIIDRQHGFSWQSLRQFIENSHGSIEVEQLYQALTQHTRH